MTLHFYIARRFLKSFLTVLASISVLYILLELLENLRRFGDRIGMVDITGLTLLNMPATMHKILPMMVVLATLFMFLGLSRSSEMVVTRAAGRPALLTMIAPSFVVFILGLLALTMLNPIAAATSKEYNRLVRFYEGGSQSIMSLSSEGFWLRQGDENGQTVIRANSAGPDGSVLYNVSFFSYSTEGSPKTRINANKAVLEEGRWALTGVKIWNLSDLSNPEHMSVETPAYWIASTLTLEGIRDSFGHPSAIPIWEMPAFITQLKQAGFSPRRHQVFFQTQLANPLFMVAMVLIGAAFTMRHTRLGNTGLMALLALLFGFGVFFVRNFATILGENGQIPVAVAAWTPPIAAMLLALGVILHLEDG